jgi:hypothetical protein
LAPEAVEEVDSSFFMFAPPQWGQATSSLPLRTSFSVIFPQEEHTNS